MPSGQEPQTPAWYPQLPPSAAAVRCDGCTWTWLAGRLVLKLCWRACPVHGRHAPPRVAG